MSGVIIDTEYLDNPQIWWKRFLDGEVDLVKSTPEDSISVLDLFSSVGGLALGTRVGAHLLGKNVIFNGAVDTDCDALAVHKNNFSTHRIIEESVRNLVDFRIVEDESGKASLKYASPEGAVADLKPDLIIGGPPCQGHSTLNNKTRGNDPKNQLMLVMPALAKALSVKAVVIENVPNVMNDSKNVVEVTEELFISAGYKVKKGVVAANKLGWPQTRKRFFMVARLEEEPINFSDVESLIKMESADLRWCIGGMEDLDDGPMDRVPELNKDNRRRIAYLFETGEYNLPNKERPECHQKGTTYKASYGRMKYDKPAPTLTTGFLTPGRGRFIHPERQRVLTPREASRVQGFPKGFDFVGAIENKSDKNSSRENLSKWIGDAVPPILGSVAAISAIG